jgi:hypothetical protein
MTETIISYRYQRQACPRVGQPTWIRRTPAVVGDLENVVVEAEQLVIVASWVRALSSRNTPSVAIVICDRLVTLVS